MIYIWLNIVPILAATAAGVLLGAAWTRMAGMKVTRGMALAALGAIFWQTAILAGAVILAPAQADRWTMALGSAFIIWIGFVMPALLVTLGVRRAGLAATAGACGYWLVAMLVQAAVLQAIGVVAPPAG